MGILDKAKVGSALSSAIGGFPAAAASAGLSWIGATLQNRQNEKLMDKQNALNVEQWNRENAYNHPAAQMARFKEAGLNPDLIYGQSNSSGSVTPSPDLPAAANPFGNMSSIMNANLNAQKVAAEVNVLDAQAYELRHRGELHQHEATELDAKIERYAHLNGVSDAEVGVLKEQVNKFAQETKNLVAENANIILRGKILSHEEAIKAVEAEFKPERERAEIDKIISDKKLNEAEAAKFRAEAHRINTLLEHEVNLMLERITLVQKQQVSEDKKAQLLQGEFEAMLPRVVEGLSVAGSAVSSAVDDRGRHIVNGSKGQWILLYSMDRLFGAIGKVLHVNLSSFSGSTSATSHRVGSVEYYEGDLSVGGRDYYETPSKP